MKGSPRKKQRSGILFAAMIANADTGNCVICYTVPAVFVSAQQIKRKWWREPACATPVQQIFALKSMSALKGSPRKKQRSGAAMMTNAEAGKCVICYTVTAVFVSAQQIKRKWWREPACATPVQQIFALKSMSALKGSP